MVVVIDKGLRKGVWQSHSLIKLPPSSVRQINKINKWDRTWEGEPMSDEIREIWNWRYGK